MEEKLSAASPHTNAHPLGSLDNPIRVNGVIGEYYYLQRLFTLAREPLFCHRLGSITMEERGSLDVYELIAQNNSGHWVLAFSHNHRTSSDAAPEGLWLDPRAPSIDSPKHPYTGTTIGVDNFVKDFPTGLPRALRKAWMGTKPSLAEFVESVLSQFTPEAWRHQPYQSILAPASVVDRAPRTELVEGSFLLPQAGGVELFLGGMRRRDDALP